MASRLCHEETDVIKELLLMTGVRGPAYVAYDVLAMLQREGAAPTASDLRRATGFESRSIKASLDQLEGLGLVERLEKTRGGSPLLRLIARKKDQ